MRGCPPSPSKEAPFDPQMSGVSKTGLFEKVQCRLQILQQQWRAKAPQMALSLCRACGRAARSVHDLLALQCLDLLDRRLQRLEPFGGLLGRRCWCRCRCGTVLALLAAAWAALAWDRAVVFGRVTTEGQGRSRWERRKEDGAGREQWSAKC